MKKIWSYLAVGFFFMSVGIIIGAKWIAGQDIHVEIKKIKNKRVSGRSDISIPVEVKTPEKRKEKRVTRRDRKNSKGD